MTIPVNIFRLGRAVVQLNREQKLPRENRLRFQIALEIAVRMNELREEGIEFHSALQQAAAEQKGVGEARAALYRKVIARYGRWTYANMKKRGYTNPFPRAKKRAGQGEILVLK